MKEERGLQAALALLCSYAMSAQPPRRNRAKHHHWVPQFYLRYFATADTRETDSPQVWIFSKHDEDGNEALTSVRNVCGKRYLYAPRQLGGERDWALEDDLTRVEGMLGEVWSALASNYVDLASESIRKAVALFVAIMHMRHPDTRKMVEHVHGELVDLYESGPKEPDGTPAVSSFEVQGRTYELDTSNWFAYRDHGRDGHDREFAKVVRSEAGVMAKHLLGKRWSVVCCDADTFVTTDKPVVLSNQYRERFGYGTRGTVLTLPLSPTRLLIMDDEHEEPANQYHQLRIGSAGAFNLRAWRGAARFLVTGRPIHEVLGEINSSAADSSAI